MTGIDPIVGWTLVVVALTWLAVARIVGESDAARWERWEAELDRWEAGLDQTDPREDGP